MSAPVLLGLHGFGGGPQSFEGLGGTPGRWLCPTLVGHGDPPAPGAADFTGEVDRIAAWVQQRADVPVRLLGYSMGARVGLGLCAQHPHLVERAVLVGVHPGLRRLEERRQRQHWEEHWIHLLETQGLAAFLAEWERLPLFDSQDSLDPQRRRAQASLRRSHCAEGLAHAFRVLGTGAMPDLWPALEQLERPVCLVVGELDSKFRALAEEAARHLPLGRLEIAARAGHNVLLEQPELLGRLLSSAAP